MGSHVALVKGNRQMGFQVGRATHILWLWLEGIGERNLSLS
jgi:hypothetical protein